MLQCTKADSRSEIRPSFPPLSTKSISCIPPNLLLLPSFRSIGATTQPTLAISRNPPPNAATQSTCEDYCPYLSESDIRALFPETLTADVEAVLADQTSGVRADAAM